MNFFDMMNVSASALTAQRARMETVSSNIANAYTTRTPEGGAYRRLDVVFEATEVGDFRSALDRALKGVRVSDVIKDPSPLRRKFEPGHPDADQAGYVNYPNVEPAIEMVNLVGASRSYEANLTVIEATKNLMLSTLQI